MPDGSPHRVSRPDPVLPAGDQARWAYQSGSHGVVVSVEDTIDIRHLSQPGLVVLDIIAADEQTAITLMDGLQQLWATSGITPVGWTPPCLAFGHGSTPTSGVGAPPASRPIRQWRRAACRTKPVTGQPVQSGLLG